MTANKSSKAVPHAGGGKAPRDVPDRSVTFGKGMGWLMCTSYNMMSEYPSDWMFCSFDLKDKQGAYLSVNSFSITSFYMMSP